MGELENGRTGWQNVGKGYGPTDDIATPEQTKAHAAAENLKHRARDQAENAKTQIRSLAETGKDRVAEQLDHVAKAVRSASDGLRGEEQTAPISQYAERIGDKIEEASRYLREHQAIDLMDEVESVARRQPLLFLGGAFAVGIAIGRFFKSSAAMSAGGGSFEPSGYGGVGSGDLGSGGYGTPEPSGGIGTSGYGTSGYGASTSYGTSSYGGTSPSSSYGTGSYGTGSYGGTSGTASSYGTTAGAALGTSNIAGSTNAGSSDLGPNDLGPSSYGQGIASADVQSGYPMGSDVQAGYPEPEQSVTKPLDTSPTPISKRLPGDDDESL